MTWARFAPGRKQYDSALNNDGILLECRRIGALGTGLPQFSRSHPASHLYIARLEPRAPHLKRVVPDRREIPLCSGNKEIRFHGRLAARNSSKSIFSGAPLSSPSTRAERRAPK